VGLEIGQRVADYEIEGLLGIGGMGRVYRVRNVISDRTEAMKVLLADVRVEPDFAARFVSEIRTLAALDHPHIAQLHTAMQVGNELIMMMEFVDGSTLHQLARQGTLPTEQVVRYVHQVLAALSFAHSRGVIHRDIKPANIMVTPRGIVKLTDFGIAKSKLQGELTRPGTTVGSLNYMSPEQAQGGCTVDGRADIYSLGVTMYELLTGKQPFEDESAYVVLHRQLHVDPRPPIQLNSLLSRSLNDLVLKALQKDPAKRFQSAAAFSEALFKATGIASPTPVVRYSRSSAAMVGRTHPGSRAAATRWVWIAPAVLSGVGVVGFAALSLPHSQVYGALAKTVSPLVSQAATVSAAAYHRMTPASDGKVSGAVLVAPIKTQANAKDPATVVAARAKEAAPATEDAMDVATLPAMPAKPSDIPKGVQSAPAPAVPLAHTSSPRRRVAEPRLAKFEYKAASIPEGISARKEEAKAPPVPAANSAELERLRSQESALNARASTVRLSVLHLKSQQEAAGDGLGQDVAGAYVRMNAYLSAGKEDLDDGDAAAARDHIAKAETEVDLLEKLFHP
jgi:eukaryotic-like serine/threonine-protein kinase